MYFIRTAALNKYSSNFDFLPADKKKLNLDFHFCKVVKGVCKHSDANLEYMLFPSELYQQSWTL